MTTTLRPTPHTNRPRDEPSLTAAHDGCQMRKQPKKREFTKPATTY